MTFRIVLQPIMAALLALGADYAMPKRADHHTFEDPTSRPALLREGWKAIARVFVLAILMDFIYEMIVLRRLYPLQLLLVAVLLAVAPYLFNSWACQSHSKTLAGYAPTHPKEYGQLIKCSTFS
jgi:hypothetical protein